MTVIFRHSKHLKKNQLCSCQFLGGDIPKIINRLDSNKANAHDMISIHMLKVCGESIFIFF